ncbi:MAG: type II secretion system major pseudopilin GspG [Nitrospinota bacterium]|nr:type II secretion system major pseudopilin GspG [Nitrospinota bacterium]
MKKRLNFIRLRHCLGNEGGWSLVELIVVMVIIGLLAGLVGPRLFRHVDTAKQKDAKAQIAMLEEALDLYRLENHRYPNSELGLAALKDYLKKELPMDPWGNPYIYNIPGPDNRDFEIVSLGQDGKPGGDGIDADIYSWK